MPAGVKDPADLHVLHADDPGKFKAVLEECIRAATPIHLGSQAANGGAAGPGRAAASDGWTAPIPCDAGRDLPPFPTRLLPPALLLFAAGCTSLLFTQ